MNLKKTVILLTILSISIYGLQLIIFRDPHTTAFYILQDMAFMPFTIAIATIVVGEIMSQREKKERIEKTRMLTSSFFSELGTALMLELYQHTRCNAEMDCIISTQIFKSDMTLEEMQQIIENATIQVKINQEVFDKVKELILEKQTGLLVISSNPLLLEHEKFTEMLWQLFHLMDEFRLRGEYINLTHADKVHFESDLSDTLKLLLLNWTTNVVYMRKQYPNFYREAMNKLTKRL